MPVRTDMGTGVRRLRNRRPTETGKRPCGMSINPVSCIHFSCMDTMHIVSVIVPLSIYPVLVGGTTGLSDCILWLLGWRYWDQMWCGWSCYWPYWECGVLVPVSLLCCPQPQLPFQTLQSGPREGWMPAAMCTRSVTFPARPPIEWYHFEQLLKRLTNCRASLLYVDLTW